MARLPTLVLRESEVAGKGPPCTIACPTSDSRSTSVGSLAIERFQRPVAYQDVPGALLPEAVRDDNPWGLQRRIDGELEK